MSQVLLRASSKRSRFLFHHFTLRCSSVTGSLINHATTSLITKESTRSSLPSSGYAEAAAVATTAPLQHFIFVRFFAAPKTVKKVHEKVVKVTRVNEEIDAPYVRLVSSEGHGIVTRTEALHRAKTFDLDLVEVDRRAEPPVCKIVDFHKEKFKKSVKDKELAKSKAETTVRKGDCKEVHFSGKIEQKDLKIKAETVKRLMERGYRVKVVAEARKKSEIPDGEKEDLGGVLNRLYNLIEDFSAVEGAPRVEKRTAYIIVRHAKFGTKKGSGKKMNKTDERDSGIRMQIDSTSTTEYPDPMVDRVLDSHQNLHSNYCSKDSGGAESLSKVPFSSGVNPETNQGYRNFPPTVDTTKERCASRENQRDESIAADRGTSRIEPLSALSNRYKRSDTSRRQNRGQLEMKQRQPLPNHFPSHNSIEDNHIDLDLNKRQHLSGHLNSRESFPSKLPNGNNKKYSQLDSRNQHSIPRDRSVITSRFGMPGAPTTAGFVEQKKNSDVNHDKRESTLNPPDLKGDAPKEEIKIERKWGIFSR